MNKKIFSGMFATVLTSAATVVVLGQFQKDQAPTTWQADAPAQEYIHQTNYTPNNNLNAAAAGGVDFEYAATKSVPAVVHIKTTSKATPVSNRNSFGFSDPFFDQFFGNPFGGVPQQRGPKMGSGSGVVVSSDGYIVTNNHVVAGADEVTVTFNDRVVKTAKIIGTDAATDLALLKIEASNLPFIDFANSDDVKLGQWVLAVGYPLSLDATVTAGIVSAKSRSIGINRQQSNKAIESFIQTDAAVNQGNSGGALVNTSGQLIGINSAIASPTGSYAGYSYAIPSNIVKKVTADLKQFGTVQRGYLGIEIRDVKGFSAEEITKYGLDKTEGVYINGFSEGSSAKDAGLKVGDIITSINTAKVRTVPELMAQVAMFKPGDKIKVDYVRDGKANTAQVLLKNTKGNTDVVKRESSEALLGASLKELNANDKAKLRVRSGLQVENVGTGLLKRHTNIKNGFIITHINDIPVNSTADVERAMEEQETVYITGVYPGSNATYHFGVQMPDRSNLN